MGNRVGGRLGGGDRVCKGWEGSVGKGVAGWGRLGMAGTMEGGADWAGGGGEMNEGRVWPAGEVGRSGRENGGEK